MVQIRDLSEEASIRPVRNYHEEDGIIITIQNRLYITHRLPSIGKKVTKWYASSLSFLGANSSRAKGLERAKELCTVD